MTPISFATFWRINTVVLAVLVTILSLISNPESLKEGFDWTAWLANLIFSDPTSSDKIEHFLAHGALGFCAFLGFVRPRGRYALPMVFGSLVLFGGVLEVLQALGGERQGDVADLVANLGGLSGGMLGAFVLILATRRVRTALQ